MNKAINYGFRRNGLVNGVPVPSIDGKYGIYNSLQEACAQVPIEERAIGLTVGIEDTDGSISEYWWKRGIGDNDLEAKNDFDFIQDQIDELNYKIDHIVPVGPGGLEIIVGSTLSYDSDTKYLNVANPLPNTMYLSGSVFYIDNVVQIDKYKTLKIGSVIEFNENGISGSAINLSGSNIYLSGGDISLHGGIHNNINILGEYGSININLTGSGGGINVYAEDNDIKMTGKNISLVSTGSILIGDTYASIVKIKNINTEMEFALNYSKIHNYGNSFKIIKEIATGNTGSLTIVLQGGGAPGEIGYVTGNGLYIKNGATLYYFSGGSFVQV